MILHEVGEINAELTVSILMPAYNSAEHIAESIHSVLTQNFKNFELIVVDDGSQDQTRSIVEKIALLDKRVKYHYKENAGVSAARNLGLMLARGKYLACLDSDDLWPEYKISEQLALLAENENLIILGAVERFYVDLNGIKIRGKTTTLQPAKNDCEHYKLDVASMQSEQMVVFNTFCGNKKHFQACGGWDEKLKNAEDWDFWLRLAAKVQFKHSVQVYQFYRKHLKSATSSSSYHVSLSSQLYALQKFIRTNQIGLMKSRDLHAQLYAGALSSLSSGQHYGQVVQVYFAAILHSNILFKKIGYQLLYRTLKRIFSRLMGGNHE